MTTATPTKPMRGKALRDFLDGLTILHGAHSPDGEMCVMEAVAFVADALRPTVVELQKSALKLVERMIAATAS